LRIEVYNSSLKKKWDDFVSVARNAHFMFYRDYIEYHSSRFCDHSLLFYDDRSRPSALLPANIAGDVLYSHQGLTFGGLILDIYTNAEDVLKIFSELKLFLVQKGIQKLVYKCLPYIYFSQPSDEDRYALFMNDAILSRRDVSSTIFIQNRGPYTKGRKWAINKAKKSEIEVERSESWEEYWKILTESLQTRHQVLPVHSLAEIKQLVDLFPENIKLFVAKKHEKIIAGTVVYENRHWLHTQYMASTPAGKIAGALDMVIDRLLVEYYPDKRVLDLGTSNAKEGRLLNAGLIAQKESFGARAVVHDFYEWILT
jgi:hypothetical protein